MRPWKDKIKRGTDDEVESSEMHVGRFRITVNRHIAYPKDVWLASCTDLFSRVELPHKDLEHAKSAAVTKVKGILDAALEDIKRLRTAPNEEARIRNARRVKPRTP